MAIEHNKSNNENFIYKPTEIWKILERKANKILSDSDFKMLVAIDGILGTAENTKYSIYYGVPLRDELGSVINLDIPKKIYEQNEGYQNKEVIVWGLLKSKFWQEKLQFAVDVTRIEPKIKLNEEFQEQEKKLSDFLRTYRRETKPFPNAENYFISVIHPKSGLTKDDLDGQLEGLENINKKYLEVDILSVDEIVNAINNSLGDILVVIRGGGTPSDFEIFNDFNLLDAWIKKDAFRISALGHTGNQTYLDIFSDVSVATPTFAGVYIKENIERNNSLKEYKSISTIHSREMIMLIDKSDKEVKEKDQKIEGKEKEIKELEGKLKEFGTKQSELLLQNQELSNNKRSLKWYLGVLIFLLLLVIAFSCWLALNR
jgi:exonuclease VII large subunit